MPAGLQVLDTDGSILFDSSVQGVQFLHTIVDGKRVLNTSDNRFMNIGDDYDAIVILEVPILVSSEIMSQLTTNNTMAFLRETPMLATDHSTGRVCVGEYKDGYMRFPLYGTEASVRSGLNSDASHYYATLVWLA